METATEQAPEAFRVPLSKLDIDEKKNPREDYGEGEMTELAASLKSRGQLVPLLVGPEKDGRYELLDGHRRARALKKIGETHAVVRVDPKLGVEKGATRLIANLERKNLSSYELARGVYELHKTHAMPVDRIVATLHKERSTIYNYVRFFEKLHPKVLAAWKAGRLTQPDLMTLVMKDHPTQLVHLRATVGKAAAGPHKRTRGAKGSGGPVLVARRMVTAHLAPLLTHVTAARRAGKTTPAYISGMEAVLKFLTGGARDVPGVYDPKPKKATKKPYELTTSEKASAKRYDRFMKAQRAKKSGAKKRR